jgi:diguanylate cyclase (GGDEF)-like protein
MTMAGEDDPTLQAVPHDPESALVTGRQVRTRKIVKRTFRISYHDVSTLLPECAAILGLLALIWVGTFVILSREKLHELEFAENTMTALSKIYSETTTRIFSDIDLTLRGVQSSYGQLGANFDIDRWTNQQSHHDKLRVQITIIDRDGYVVKSTLARSNSKPISIADRPHFKYQLDPSRDDLYISDPVLGRGSGNWTIQLTRKLLTSDGGFDGVVVLSLGFDQLSKFYDSARAAGADVAIINGRGAVIAESDGQMPASLPSSQWILGVGNGTDMMHDTDGSLLSRTRIPDFPVYVLVTRPQDKMLSRYQTAVRNFTLVATLASAVVAFIGAFWISQRHRNSTTSRALAITLAGMNQGIAMINDRGTLSVANETALRLLTQPGTRQPEIGDDVSFGWLLEHSQRLVKTKDDYDLIGDAPSEARTVTHEGRVIEIRTADLPEGGQVHTFTDVTQQSEFQSRIHYLAHHDALTGLPNRLNLERRIAQMLKNAEATGGKVLVMFIDLDGFKGVNDTLGHETGDHLLIRVADAISSSASSGDFVARLGGDEFIFVRSTSGDVEVASSVADMLLEKISDPVIIDGHELRISTSIGIAVAPRDGTDHHSLFKRADIALYRAKNEGRATKRFFEASMGEHLDRRMMLEEDLRAALKAGALEVHYQPQFDINASRVVCFEALVRWNHPVHGWISPQAFIPVAEECGLIARLGGYVLERACSDAAAWPSPCQVGVNISAYQLLEAGFADHVRAILERTGLPPQRLELELTESAMVDTTRHLISTLEDIRNQGISLALDDFGTGYSSLNNLLRFHFDKVKIDKSFVQEQMRDGEARAILEAILAMSRHIGLKVTAEGVETEQQLAMLREQGCVVCQGYLFGRPAINRTAVQLLTDLAADVVIPAGDD